MSKEPENCNLTANTNEILVFEIISFLVRERERGKGDFSLSLFLRFASEGGSYDKVIHAIRSAWNVSLTLIGQEKTRGGLFLPFKEMLNDVMKLAGRRVEVHATYIYMYSRQYMYLYCNSR